MTSEQMSHYQTLRTVPERAAYLLAIGVTARPNIVGLDVVSQACVGDVLLPVTAASEALAIRKGRAWLQQKAQQQGAGQ